MSSKSPAKITKRWNRLRAMLARSSRIMRSGCVIVCVWNKQNLVKCFVNIKLIIFKWVILKSQMLWMNCIYEFLRVSKYVSEFHLAMGLKQRSKILIIIVSCFNFVHWGSDFTTQAFCQSVTVLLGVILQSVLELTQ